MHTQGLYAAECVLDLVWICVKTQYAPAVCARATDVERRVSERNPAAALVSTPADRAIQISPASGIFPARGAGSAAPARPFTPHRRSLLSRNTRSVPGHSPCNRGSKNARGNCLLRTNNGAVFAFPFSIPFGLFCFFIFIGFLHLHSRATPETEVEYILHYVSMIFVSVRSIFIFRYILSIDFRVTIRQSMCTLPSTRKFMSNHLIIHNFYITCVLRHLGKEFYTQRNFLKAIWWNPCSWCFAGTVSAWFHQRVSEGWPLPTTVIAVVVITGKMKKETQIMPPEKNLFQEIIANLFLILLSSA